VQRLVAAAARRTIDEVLADHTAYPGRRSGR
jgi:hypothetical protein